MAINVTMTDCVLHVGLIGLENFATLVYMAGRYGFNCEKTCSPGCLKHTCSSSDGKCECKDYYKGDTCDECVEGRNGDHCLNLVQPTQPSNTDNNPTRALAVGVICAVGVLVAGVAVAIVARRKKSTWEAQCKSDEHATSPPRGEAAQPGLYESLDTTRTETNDRRDTYTRLFTTRLAETIENVNSDSNTMNHLNIEGGKVAQSGPYETLNATHLKENDRNESYKMLSMTEHARASGNSNFNGIPPINPDSHSYANMMLKK
ncbi:uncharacterized protein LOC128220366 isoform X2 [Mya arenaria]|uniref:uncharacterized protein LOC128220366 isoform X2 n=1 Tax=Mya arenaria TaxID=6604 RepID=UPI0022E19077|nr:uncharacterized protein LOC128220366 isoform X2 [Mya arenaria]